VAHERLTDVSCDTLGEKLAHPCHKVYFEKELLVIFVCNWSLEKEFMKLTVM